MVGVVWCGLSSVVWLVECVVVWRGFVWCKAMWCGWRGWWDVVGYGVEWGSVM